MTPELWALERGLGAGWTPELAAARSGAYRQLSGAMIGLTTLEQSRSV